MLRIEIENRPLITVRMIPFITGGRLSPDVITSILADDNEVHPVFIPSYHLDSDGKYHPMLAEEWDTVCADLGILNRKFSAHKTVDNHDSPILHRESIRILPPATFVWLDELEIAWHAAFSEEHMHIVSKRPGDRQLNLKPLIPPNEAKLVYEGFEPLLIYTNPLGSSSPTAIIRFEELYHYMMLDPFYGVESAAIESIINGLYRENSGNQLFLQFIRRFSLLPCKTDQQRHLIYLWCGLMGLPAYRDNQPLNWKREDFLEHWTEDFDLRLDEIKAFLRKHSWPLPTWFFPDEVDNTERKLALDGAEFDAAFHEFTVVLPQLEEELAEIQAIQPESMEAWREKKTEAARIEQKIATIKHGHIPEPATQPPAAETLNCFALTGDHWTITYQNQTRTFNNTKGLRYIAWLLRNQGKEILIADLYYAINPPDTQVVDSIHSAMTANQLNEMGLSIGDLGDAGDRLTPDGKKRLEQEIRYIQERIEEANEFGDVEKSTELEQQQEEILNYIAVESGLGGKTRKASSNIERIRTSVTMNISRAKEKITRELPELAQHLNAYLETGTLCKYTPHPPIDWVIDSS